jgi:hypothetical protein
MPIYGGDARAHDTKALIDAGRRLPSDAPIEREYFCRTCGSTVRNRGIPSGWYQLQRANALISAPIRLGLYCSLSCLIDMLPRLEGIDSDLATRDWEQRTAASSYPQRRTGKRWSAGSRR